MIKRMVSACLLASMYLLYCNGNLKVRNDYNTLIKEVSWGGKTGFGDIEPGGENSKDVEPGSYPLKFKKTDTLFITIDNIEIDARSGATYSLNSETRIRPVSE